MLQVVSVDGTFLHGKYGGTLVTAVAQDANHQVYPLAFAIVETENDVGWTWFFHQLLNVVPNTPGLMILSDRHKSIKKAVSIVYTSAKHICCKRHLQQNLVTRFHDSGLMSLYNQAADAYTTMEFDGYFNDICRLNPEMGKYLTDADFRKWSRAHCEGDRYNMMTTNNSECVNSALKIARSYQLVSLFEFIRDMVTRWFYERRTKALAYEGQPSEVVIAILNARLDLSSRYDIKPLNDAQFQVTGGTFSGIVDLAKKTCCCRVFDLDHYPCTHAICAIQKMQYRVGDFIDDHFKSSYWLNAYKETLYPLPYKTTWDVPDAIKHMTCLPPKNSRKVGRPRVKRLPSLGEFKKEVRKRGQPSTYRCSLCGKDGHNKKRCPSAPPSAGKLCIKYKTKKT